MMFRPPYKTDEQLMLGLVDSLNKISNYPWSYPGGDEVLLRITIGNRTFGYVHRVNPDALQYSRVPMSVIAQDILSSACVSLGKTILKKE